MLWASVVHSLKPRFSEYESVSCPPTAVLPALVTEMSLLVLLVY
ncbi:MAG: hypothetical protein U0Q10_08905 [Dermatophilaceae bacterium]